MKTKESIGLWKSKSGWYISSPIKKAEWNEMPKCFKIILKQNKYWKSNDGEKPRFILYLVDGMSAKNMRNLEFDQDEYYCDFVLKDKNDYTLYTLNGERLYREDEI